jgi:hypothetical protein
MAAAIEVLDKQALSYTLGTLKDISNEQYLVDFGKPTGQRWIGWALVREAPAACAEFIPELVRASTNASTSAQRRKKTLLHAVHRRSGGAPALPLFRCSMLLVCSSLS